MLYVFIFLIICSFIKQRQKLFGQKRNLVLFLLFSMTGIVLGIVHSMFPYIPSIAMALENYMK